MKPKKTAPAVVTVDRRPAFLKAYRATAQITKAADAAGIERSTHYRWLTDEDYAAEFRQAQIEAAQLLEDEAIRRAHDGVSRPVIYQGEICYADDGEPIVEIEYSDSLLTFLLKGFNPAKYKDRASVEHSGPGGGPIPIDARLALLTDEELASLTAIAEKLTAAPQPTSGTDPAQPE